jgi:hypothetical protein
MTMAYVVAGVLLIVAGRRVFWLFLGLLCFVAGMNFLQRWFPDTPQTTLLLASVGIGALGAGIGMIAQKTAVWVGGFLGGGFLAVMLVRMVTQEDGSATLVAFLAGGVIGIFLARHIFKWVMIVVSSAIGALIICKALLTGVLPGAVVFGILLLAGVAIQSGFLWRGRSSSRKSGSEPRDAGKVLPGKPSGI